MLNKLYIYLLFNISKVNVPLSAFVAYQTPFSPHQTFVPPPHAEICMDNPEGEEGVGGGKF